jgi:hypothetical protein
MWFGAGGCPFRTVFSGFLAFLARAVNKRANRLLWPGTETSAKLRARAGADQAVKMPSRGRKHVDEAAL